MESLTINAGELNTPIQLERDIVTREKGVEKKTPEVYATAWAKPEALSGRELIAAQQLAASVNWRFTIRYREDVRPQHRVVMDGRRMEIRAVLPELQKRMLVTLLCEAKG